MSRGRLVKKNQQDKIGTMHVESYPWQDFSAETILLPDNPRKSVVLAKSHPKQEMESKVQVPREFSKSFSAPSKPLLPQDLTADYLASQEELRQRKLRMQMNEDEAVALELMDLESNKISQHTDELEQVTDADHAREANATAAASASKTGLRSSGPDISDLSKLAAQKIRSFGDGDLEFRGAQISEDELEQKLKSAFEAGLAQGKIEGEKFGLELAMKQAHESAERESVPSDVSQKSFEQGIEEGVLRGKEIALQEAEEKYNHSLTLFTKALSELQHLKGELLVTGREIFAEIAQICAEKVLRTSVRLNDQALRSVFDAATSQFQSQDELKIEMHPDDIARMEAQIEPDQRKRVRLVSNNKLERGDLKIEANNEVVSLEIHQTVQQVIDSLKDDLFEDVSKDGKTDKVG